MKKRGKMIRYPIRCKIIDVKGIEVFPDIEGRTPDRSKPYIGMTGLAERVDGVVRIALDNGETIMGYECWWEPLGEIE